MRGALDAMWNLPEKSEVTLLYRSVLRRRSTVLPLLMVSCGSILFQRFPSANLERPIV